MVGAVDHGSPSGPANKAFELTPTSAAISFIRDGRSSTPRR